MLIMWAGDARKIFATLDGKHLFDDCYPPRSLRPPFVL